MRTESQRVNQRRYMSKRYAERRAKLDAIKLERGCIDCPPGTIWHPAALEFDHEDLSQKSFQLSKACNRSWESILNEIAKCVVRCANHHHTKTALMKDHKRREGFVSFDISRS